MFLFDGGVDGAVGEAGLYLVAFLKGLRISDCLAVLEGDAIASFQE